MQLNIYKECVQCYVYVAKVKKGITYVGLPIMYVDFGEILKSSHTIKKILVSRNPIPFYWKNSTCLAVRFKTSFSIDWLTKMSNIRIRLETEAKKGYHPKIKLFTKNLKFLPNVTDIQAILSSRELVILTKIHNNWIKMWIFKLYFWVSNIFCINLKISFQF